MSNSIDNYVSYYKENDLVWCPFLKKGQPDLPGKVVSTDEKTTGQWCKVEVTFTDLAGKEHTTIVPKIHASKLTVRKEESGDTITTSQLSEREQLFVWGKERNFPETHFSLGEKHQNGKLVLGRLLAGEEQWQRFCHEGDKATVEKALQAALRGTVA